MAETSKAHERRVKEHFFTKYVHEPIIDIGVGRIDTYDGADPLTPTCDTWDKDNGDAHFMKGVEDETYNTVYNSHLLEHLEDPITAIRNWFRILKPQGHLIIAVPHRDLYERKKTLPSKWNLDHKYFILPTTSEPPHTFSLKDIVQSALVGLEYQIKMLRVCDTSNNHDKPEEHANGEYQIEIIVQKL